MAQRKAYIPATHLHSWAALVASLSDPALLIDADDRLVAGNRAARRLIGASLDVPGANVRALLGLRGEASLDGPATLRPPASGLTLKALLQRQPCFDERGLAVGSLLLLRVGAARAGLTNVKQLEGRLREVALTISGTLEIGQVLEHVVRLSIELTGAASGSLPLYDPQFDRLLPSHAVGIEAPQLLAPVRRGTGAVWHLIDTGETFVRNDYPSDPRAMPSLVAAGVRAVAAAPVRAGNQLLGVLNLYHTQPGRHFTPRDLELIEMVGRHAGVALPNARRYEQVQRESERRQLLYQASMALGAALAPEQLYAVIHRTLAQMMACDTIAIALLDAAADELEYVYLADGRGRWPNERLPLSRGLLGTIMRTGMALRVTGCDAEDERHFGAEPFGEGEDPTGSLVATPLLVGGEICGAITVQAVAPDAYSADDLDALEALGAMAAIALQNARLFARVHELATRDGLTGAASRRHFFEQARLEVERAGRYGRALSLLMIDADHFKQINDRYGHAAGDEVLRAIAARCRAGLREVDLFGRYGGEEFLVLLPETPGAQALHVAERLRALVAAEPVETAAGPISVQISVGLASLAVGETASVEALLDKVDRALYAAKAAGRNTTRA